MNIHKNARSTPIGRERPVRQQVEGGQTPEAAARSAGVCPRTVRKWLARFRAEGVAATMLRAPDGSDIELISRVPSPVADGPLSWSV